MHYDLPSVGFKKPYLNIDNVKFENPMPNDISAFEAFKSTSTHQNDFLINYITNILIIIEYTFGIFHDK